MQPFLDFRHPCTGCIRKNKNQHCGLIPSAMLHFHCFLVSTHELDRASVSHVFGSLSCQVSCFYFQSVRIGYIQRSISFAWRAAAWQFRTYAYFVPGQLWADLFIPPGRLLTCHAFLSR